MQKLCWKHSKYFTLPFLLNTEGISRIRFKIISYHYTILQCHSIVQIYIKINSEQNVSSSRCIIHSKIIKLSSKMEFSKTNTYIRIVSVAWRSPSSPPPPPLSRPRENLRDNLKLKSTRAKFWIHIINNE